MSISVPDFECVGFAGFYSGAFDTAENLYDQINYDERNELEIPADSLVEDEDYKFDYDGYRGDICNGWIAVMNRYIREVLDIDCELVAPELFRPKTYNYNRDRLYCGFKCRDFKWIINHRVLPMMRKHKKALAEIIYDNHTSYDGFCSFMSNKYEEWYSYLANSKNYKDRDFCLYFSYIIVYLIAVCEYKEDYGAKFINAITMEVYSDYESIHEHLHYLLTADELIAKYGSAE